MDDNTFKVTIALVNSLPALVGGLAAIAASYFSWRSHVTAKITQEMTKQVEIATNGMKAELVASTKLAAFQAGKISEAQNPGNGDKE